MKCLSASMIPLRVSLNSPRTSRMNCEFPSQICWPKHGCNEIRLGWPATHFRVGGRGHGSGIAPGHLPGVFDRFCRAVLSRGSDGAGLGLALVKSIVGLHGGTARIQSEIDRGTTVSLTFPK